MSTAPIPITTAHFMAAAQDADDQNLGDLADAQAIERAGVEESGSALLALEVATLRDAGFELTDEVLVIVGKAWNLGTIIGATAARYADAEAFDR